jgi:hypothetical protein
MIGKELLEMKNCEITNKEKNITIKGEIDNASKPDKPNLLLVKDTEIKKIDCEYKHLGGKQYELVCFPKTSINSNLHRTIGRYNDTSNIILSFGDTNTKLNFTQPINDVFMRKKSSGGLSTGAIIGIIIPCLAVLLAVAGVAFIIGNKQPVPPVQNLGNSTIGISSTSNINNK